MGDVINLRQKRKALKRLADRQAADRNAALHGLPKRVTDLAEARRRKDAEAVEAHRLDPPKRPRRE